MKESAVCTPHEGAPGSPHYFGIRSPWGWELLQIASVSLLVIFAVLFSTPLIELNGGRDSDGMVYAAMAEHGIGGSNLASSPPWAYRVLTPFLVSLVPFLDVPWNFRLLSGTASYINLILIYLLCRGYRVNHSFALYGALLYGGVFWTTKFALYSPCYVDAITQTILLSTFLLMVYRRYKVAALVLTIGVLQKESTLFFVPVLLACLRSRGARWRVVLGYGGATIAGGAVLLATVREFVVASHAYSPVTEVLKVIEGQILNPSFYPLLLLELLSGTGVLLFLLLAYIRTALPILRDEPHLLVAIGVAIVQLGGGVDKARLLLPIVPVLVLLTVRALQVRLGRVEGSFGWLTAILLLHLHAGHYLTPFESTDDYLNSMVPIHATGPLGPTYVKFLGIVFAFFLVARLHRFMGRTTEAT